jgi:hypothetical protein
MYPIHLGFDDAIERIQELRRNGHSAEALLSSVFSTEKTLRRTLRQLVVSAGFTSKQSQALCSTIRGFGAIKKNWPVFDPNGRNLPSLLPSDEWKNITVAVEMRNKLVHGTRVYDSAICDQQSEAMIRALSALRHSFQDVYGFDGWERLAVRRKPRIHLDPKVKIQKAEPEN